MRKGKLFRGVWFEIFKKEWGNQPTWFPYCLFDQFNDFIYPILIPKALYIHSSFTSSHILENHSTYPPPKIQHNPPKNQPIPRNPPPTTYIRHHTTRSIREGRRKREKILHEGKKVVAEKKREKEQRGWKAEEGRGCGGDKGEGGGSGGRGKGSNK